MITYNTYDTKSRLVAARTYASGTLTDSATYILDALDRTLSETELHSGTTTRTDFVYIGLSGAVGQEQLFSASGTLTETKSYAYDADGRRMTLTDALVGGATSRYSYVFDPHGSVEALIDQSRAVKASYGYDAYGNSNLSLTKTAAGFSPNTNAYRYDGQRFDTGSGTVDFGARRYSASTGRFIQRDAYLGALDDLSRSSDAINGNRYALTGANPINFVDSDGHMFAIDTGGAVAKSICEIYPAACNKPGAAPTPAPPKPADPTSEHSCSDCPLTPPTNLTDSQEATWWMQHPRQLEDYLQKNCGNDRGLACNPPWIVKRATGSYNPPKGSPSVWDMLFLVTVAVPWV